MTHLSVAEQQELLRINASAVDELARLRARCERLESALAAAPEEDYEIVKAMTRAMREADETFERVGGSTRHHVRDCLLPNLYKHGLVIALRAALAAEPVHQAVNAPVCEMCGGSGGSGHVKAIEPSPDFLTPFRTEWLPCPKCGGREGR